VINQAGSRLPVSPSIVIGFISLAHERKESLPFWAGRIRDAWFLCHEFTRVFAKDFSNSCLFAKVVAKVLGLPVNNGRARKDWGQTNLPSKATKCLSCQMKQNCSYSVMN